MTVAASSIPYTIKDFSEMASKSFPESHIDSSLGGLVEAGYSNEYILSVIKELQRRQKDVSYKNMFVPGTQYGIEKCPKHYAFFEATKTYKQTMFRAGNRVGKTQAGAFAITVWTVQDYPEWWPGKVFRGPVTTWACGKTVQVTRETVQKALLGPLNSPGTGTIPQERIKKIWGRAGNPGAVDTIEIMNDWGDVSLIGFKSYDQKLESFVGVALHAGWLDEEADRLVSNEILWRTATTDGVLINTVTPLNGLTEYIADFDKGADHLAGAEPIVGVEDE